MKNALTISKLVFFLLVITSSLKISAKTIYFIKQGGTGDGSSWTKAAGNIQTMIDKAVAGDEVWVAKGTYFPTTETIARDNRSRTFVPKNDVNLYGGFAGNETAITQRQIADLDNSGKIDSFELINQTHLSGDVDGVEDIWTKIIDSDKKTWNWSVKGNEGNCYHVVDFTYKKAIMDGFKISGGNENRENGLGGGIIAYGSGAIIKNCTVTKCKATNGGGVYLESLISNCDVYDCTASLGGGIYTICRGENVINLVRCNVSNCTAMKGGGIFGEKYDNNNYINISSIKFCTVINCSASKDGGGICAENVRSDGNETFQILNCTLKNCNAGVRGGGIFSNGTISVIEFCNVFNCYSNYGGGINSYDTPIQNCYLNNCIAEGDGGGIFSFSATTINCTICNCTCNSIGGGGGIYSAGDIVNCAVNNCEGGGIKISEYYDVVMCSVSNNRNGNMISNIIGGKVLNYIEPDIKTTYIKPTNFTGVAITTEQKNEVLNANWHLKEGSLCINMGSTNDISNAFLTGNDLDGSPRMLYGKIDIGAYEHFIPKINLPISEDFDNWKDFENSLVLYPLGEFSRNDSKIYWIVDNKKVVFNWKTNLTNNYSKSIFTYMVDATKVSQVFLNYDLYFEAYSGTVTPLGTEKLKIEYSFDFINWHSITSYSNLNGTINNKTYTHDLSKNVAGKSFFIRFTAYGVNSNRIEKWELDNIKVTDGKITGISNFKDVSYLYHIDHKGIVKLWNLPAAVKIQLFDINGKLVKYYNTSNSSVNIILPEHGVYVLRTESTSGIESRKIIW